VSKNYEKYKSLLDIDNEKSYINKLQELYIYDENFNTSIEISVIFQICLILVTLEDMYKITSLKDYFKKIKTQSNNSDNEKNESKEIKLEEDKGKKGEKREPLVIFPNPLNGNAYQSGNFRSESMLLDDCEMETNYIKGSHLNNTQNRIILREINDSPYTLLKENYRKIKQKKDEEKERKKNLLKEKNKRKTKLDKDNLNFDSIFVKAIYYFLFSLVSKVEIRMILNDENTNNNNENVNNVKFLANKVSKELLKLKNENKRLSMIEEANKPIKNDEFKYQFDLEKGDEKEEIENNGNKKAYFIKPYLSFHLSETTKHYFINNVDRTYISNKYSSLISFSDYCIFEMMYNLRFVNNNNIIKRLSNIDFYYMQVINYILILFENALIIFHYYRSPSLSQEEYYVVEKEILYKRFGDVVAIIIIKMALTVFVLFIWFYCKFVITYQRNIIFKGNHNFIFRKSSVNPQNINQPTIVNFFQNEGYLLETMNLINKNLSILSKIKIALFDSILANLEINIFIFSFFLDLLFILVGSPIFLSIEVLFIVVIFPFLLNILRAFTDNFTGLISSLFFSYCMLYVYSWIAIFYLRDQYPFFDIIEYQSETYIDEPFCHSSIQCLLIFMNYGFRYGIAIGDESPVISYRFGTTTFILRFIYDITYYNLVTMIMWDVIYALIVDSFGVLRDETYKYENDKENICFICQLTKDGCLLKNIDFDYHVKNDHNIWNYVDFLCYLHLYDPNNFSRVENYVWEKLIEKDFGWIPIDNNANDDDDDEDEDED
jgi:hypothetical protein